MPIVEADSMVGESDVNLIRSAAVFSLFAFLGAVLLPYSSSTSDASLIHTPGDIGYNVGLFVVVLFGAILALRRSTIAFSVTFAFVALAWWLPGVVQNTVAAIHEGVSLKAGAYLAYGGVAALLAQVTMGLRMRIVRLKITRSGFRTSVIAGLIAVIWGVGEFLPWIQFTYKSTLSGFTFNASDTSTEVVRCCTLFSNAVPASATSDSALVIILIVVAAVALSYLFPGALSGVGVAALSIGFCGEIVSGLQRISNSSPPLRDFYSGSGLTNAISNKITVAVAGLPGLWINLAAEFAMLLLGAYVFLASRIAE